MQNGNFPRPVFLKDRRRIGPELEYRISLRLAQGSLEENEFLK